MAEFSLISTYNQRRRQSWWVACPPYNECFFCFRLSFAKVSGCLKNNIEALSNKKFVLPDKAGHNLIAHCSLHTAVCLQYGKQWQTLFTDFFAAVHIAKFNHRGGVNGVGSCTAE